MPLPAQKHFQPADQERFAAASGDRNPMHMDPLAARRTQMGAPVVHGMHTALLCLDHFAQFTQHLPTISTLTVSFLKPVYVGDEVTFSLVRTSPLRLAAEVGGVKVMTVDLASDPQGKKLPLQSVATEPPKMDRTPRERAFAEIEKAVGTKERMALSNSPGKLFPDAARWIGADRVAALAALSTLVGMECPGLHSIFIGFTVELAEEGPADHLEYSVFSTDDRFRRVKLGVAGGGLKGTVDAAVRTPPVTQPSLREIAARVKKGSFKGQRVLVVGGSRGIGEYTAKVIAAGGGQVTVTYTVGVKEAQALVAEIKAFGCEAELLPYDVRLPAAAQLEGLKFAPTHVYYFATGRIFGRHNPEFNQSLYEEFRRFYVTGFQDLCAALYKRTQRFSVFYPSSVAVEPEGRPKGLAEYAKAKEEGEKLCADMKRFLPGVEVTVKRLPRLPTDQTATLMPVPGEEPMNTLLPMILEMQRS